MSRFTTPTFDDFVDGAIPQWFVTRFKNSLSASVCPSNAVGTATDRNVDPAITAISTTLAGAAGVCNTPTHLDWSAKVGGMVFRAEIENNTAGNLSVDLEFYRAVYGDSGSVEDWQLFKGVPGVTTGEEIRLATSQSRIFVRISGITNPDSDAQLYLSARMASPDEVSGGGDLDIDEGIPARGMFGWNTSLSPARWVRMVVGAAGFPIVEARQAVAALLNCTEASAATILTNVVNILTQATTTATQTTNTATSTASIDTELQTVIEDHDAVQADAAIVKVGGLAHAGTPAAVIAGDNAQMAFDATQSQRVYNSQSTHYSNDSATTRETPASGINEGSTQIADDAATPLAASSTPCIEVTVQNQTGNDPIGIGGSTIAAIANDGILLIGGASITLKIDDVNKVNAWATTDLERLDYTYLTRA
jgi:hypothetical protein